MYQNRVDPWGVPHAVPQRGAWYGNKGCLHDAQGNIRRAFGVRRWITCVCQFRGRKRKLLQPGRFTELFFHDEATAYAAGHRPCAQCRHADWVQFSGLWAGLFGAAKADEMDRVLHAARLDGPTRRLVDLPVADIPVGAICVIDDAPVLRGPDAPDGAPWWRWGFAGYQPVPPPQGHRVSVLTPLPIVRMMAVGLRVQMALETAPK